MNLAPRGAAADDKESIALRPSFLPLFIFRCSAGLLSQPSWFSLLLRTLRALRLCVIFSDAGNAPYSNLCRFASMLCCFLLLLNFPHAFSASLPAPRQHPPPPHQIPRPRLGPRSPHQPLRRPRPRPRLGPLLRRRQMGQRQAHSR